MSKTADSLKSAVLRVTVSCMPAILLTGGSAGVVAQEAVSAPAASTTACGGTQSGGTSNSGASNAQCSDTAGVSAAFTWVSGSNTVEAPGVYGTQGTPSATNTPGAREDATTWTDSNGNFWLFGGFGVYDAAGDSFVLNDLWQFSPVSREWTWVSGSTVPAEGMYGAQGVAAATNMPGSRAGAVSWTDAGGNLWLFGGFGIDSTGATGYLNDLWRYSPSSGAWTWISGSAIKGAIGVYGTQGSAAVTNMPGARTAANSWIDASGNLWLFGGVGTPGPNLMNDLWEYSPSNGEWTWVSGSSTGGAPGVYGTQGVAAATNVPGARNGAVSWMDAAGNLWLFGGTAIDSKGVGGAPNDLWEYSPSSGEWTWVNGSNVQGLNGVYGTQGVAAATNAPPGRFGAVSWADGSGNLWLFGGLVAGPFGVNNWENDLWEYSPSSGEWTWVSGSDVIGAAGVYGTQGVAAISNVPGARYSAAGWADVKGELWLFGGLAVDSTATAGDLNDLWQICILPPRGKGRPPFREQVRHACRPEPGSSRN